MYFVFLNQAVLPRAPELFFNRHNNKVAVVDAIKGSHYAFFTLLREFSVHNWHERKRVKKDKDHLKAMDSLLYGKYRKIYDKHKKKGRGRAESKFDKNGYIQKRREKGEGREREEGK